MPTTTSTFSQSTQTTRPPFSSTTNVQAKGLAGAEPREGPIGPRRAVLGPRIDAPRQWVGSQRPMSISRGAASRAQRGLRLLLLGVLALFALWVTASWMGERAVLHPGRWGDGPTPAAHGWAYRDVSFR